MANNVKILNLRVRRKRKKVQKVNHHLMTKNKQKEKRKVLKKM